MIRLLLSLVAILALGGCGAESRTEGSSDREVVQESHTTTKEVTRITPTENGGQVIEKITTTDTTGGERSKTSRQERTLTGPDQSTQGMLSSLGQVTGAVMQAAGVPSGTLLGTGLAGLLTAGVTAWGAAKSAQANQLRQERDFHKDDAEKGWSKAMEAKQA